MPIPTPPTAPNWRTRLLRADPETGWEGSRWTSAVLEPGFAADQAVASWNADAGVSAHVKIRARDIDGTWSEWLLLAEWGEPGARRSPSGTPDAASGAPFVDTDVLKARPAHPFDAAQLRVTLDGRPDAAPALLLAAASFTAPADAALVAADGSSAGVVGAAAALRPLSQRAYPAREDLGGGPVWCSPTSLTMVLTAWGAEVPEAPADAPDGTDSHVPWVARAVHDTVYAGTGNWSFNAAVAGSLGFDAVVTRLPSLRDARALTDAGIPVISSIRFTDRAELPGADYEAPTGHLVVIRGFTADGDVLVADPASPGGNAGLRTYPRAAFDTAWSRSRRTVYLVTPRGHELPEAPGDGAW
ncbi:C39 family peptidase [Microbacterium sp. KUDC0406]|uniref:C39 family peptidase n=1 Tax=Microbacterium sp. KUDC0406 TaxID=2909588 RepID=UPI001F17882F|nr:C39 family peptidase [Microbacterium sp. KUDC0406]UJP09125.1 C39 family peptidase [Microbacterium sp. KUDC0406]